MTNKNFKTVIIFCLFLSFAASGYAAETIAVILKAKGDVNIVRGNKSSQVKVKRGFRLEHGDKLVTGKKGYAALRFIDDASLLRVRANSTCIIRGEKQKNRVLKNVYLEVGTIFARVTKQKGKFEISTPTSVASVKGTEWYTEQRYEGGTFYYCTDGAIEVTNDAGTALVKEGETGYVESSETPPQTFVTKDGTIPEIEEVESETDLFEFEFENEEGHKKLLKFKSTPVEE